MLCNKHSARSERSERTRQLHISVVYTIKERVIKVAYTPNTFDIVIQFMLHARKANNITKEELIKWLIEVYYNSRDKNNVQSLYTSILLPEIFQELNTVLFSQNKTQSAYKYDDYFLPLEYITPKSEHTQQTEEDTMNGVDYINNKFQRKYPHMRRMLQKIWDIRCTHLSLRFDIDQSFKFDPLAIAGYIQSIASASEINIAHGAVRSEYKGRGRPVGARNKSTVFGTTPDIVIIDDPLVKDLPDIEDITNEQLLKELEAPDTLKTNQTLDTSKFVTKVEFSNKIIPIENSIRNAHDNLKAIEAWGRETDDRIQALERAKPTIIEIKQAPELPPIQLGVQHFQFEKLVRMLQARLPTGYPIIPWVYGPAGTGKTTACENASKVFNTEFRTMGTTLAKFEILGFVNTTGYQTTPFREAYENGYLFCADEIDSWAKEATVAINGALANGVCNFADKMVKRHHNFMMVACANTIGQGATMDYVGRNKQDGATLDRFVYLNWPLDEALEDSLCTNKDWLSYVRKVRYKAQCSGINPKPMITPRASMAGAALLNAGIELPYVIDMCLRKGLSDAQWNQIK